MKHLFIFAVTVFFVSTISLAYAAGQPTPSTPAAVRPVVTHTPEVQYRIRLSNQTKLITISVSKGKITKQQEKDLRSSLKAIRQQEITYKKSNSDHKLTPTQVSQLNTLLDKNSQEIDEAPATN